MYPCTWLRKARFTDTSQPDEVPPPTFQDTFLCRGPIFLYNITAGRFLNMQVSKAVYTEGGEQDEAAVALNSALPPNANAEARKRRAKANS